MKRLLCIGCSNGSHFESVFTELMPQWQIHPLSSPAAGNRFITNRLIEWIAVNGKPDRVYLQFSGVWRRDICYDPTWSLSGYEYQTHTQWFTWIHSGGFYGNWLLNKSALKLFEHQHAVIESDRSQVAQQNLAEIATAVAVCNNLNLPMQWSTYYNYLRPHSDLIKNNDGFINKWPQWLSLDQHIKWTPIEHAHKLQKIPQDEIHFSREVFRDWLLSYGSWLIS